MSTAHPPRKRNAYETHSKLKALAAMVTGLHHRGCVPDIDECYGIERILMEIAYEVCPEERPGGAA